MATFRLVQPDGLKVVNLKAAGTAIAEGVAVKTATALAAAGNADTGIGITMAPIAASSFGPVAIAGTFEGTAASGVNFAPGDKVYLEANGELGTGAMGEKAFGYVVNTDPATGGLVQFELVSDLYVQFTHG